MNESTNGEVPAAFRWIFGLGFMFIGLVFLVLGGYQLLQGLKTKDWPTGARHNSEHLAVDQP